MCNFNIKRSVERDAKWGSLIWDLADCSQDLSAEENIIKKKDCIEEYKNYFYSEFNFLRGSDTLSDTAVVNTNELSPFKTVKDIREGVQKLYDFIDYGGFIPIELNGVLNDLMTLPNEVVRERALSGYYLE